MPSAANSPARQVRHRDADTHRPLPRQPGDRHQSAHALRDLVEARPAGIGSGLAEAGDRGIDDLLVDLGEVLVVDAEPALHVRPIVLDDDIRLLDELLERRDAFLALQVERDAALVAVQILKIRTQPRPAHVALFDVFRRLDLDDIGAPIGELAHAGRAGTHACQIENGEAGQGFGSTRRRHS